MPKCLPEGFAISALLHIIILHLTIFNSAMGYNYFSCRYAHCSVQRSDGEVIVYGGFGSSPTTGVHSRLNSMIGVTFCDSQLQVRNIQLCGDEECKPGNVLN